MKKAKKIHTDLVALDKMTDADIQAGIENDPDAISDEEILKLKRVRGPQRSPTKVPVYLRLSSEILDHFKADGARGWQTRLNKHLIDTIKPIRRMSFIDTDANLVQVRHHARVATKGDSRSNKQRDANVSAKGTKIKKARVSRSKKRA